MAVTLALVLVAVGCGRNEAPVKAKATTTAAKVDLLCDLIEVPLKSMRSDGVSFMDVVEDQTGRGADKAISAMVALGLFARGRQQAGRFKPVLGYLADRSIAAASPTPKPAPRLTDLIRSNTRALDAELANGRCG